MNKTGVLLINLGTPDSPDVSSVRRYLKSFLSDPRVLDIPRLVRSVLLYGWILPFRARQSAKAYAAIWDKEQGSPLLFNSKSFCQALQAFLGSDYQVELAMRYGNPTIESALEKFAQSHCNKIIALPLFPQYSSAATGSAIEAMLKAYSAQWNLPTLSVIDKFYDNEHYLHAISNHMKAYLAANNNAHILFSYHSLPVRQIQKSKQACQKACFDNEACQAIKANTQYCYRAQCYETSRKIADLCDIKEQNYTIAFQSRLGRTVWIGPELQSTFSQLIAKGVKELMIVCPSFVADCLETLEEIGIRAKEEWQGLGGEKLTLIPCLNANEDWVKATAKILCL